MTHRVHKDARKRIVAMQNKPNPYTAIALQMSLALNDFLGQRITETELNSLLTYYEEKAKHG